MWRRRRKPSALLRYKQRAPIGIGKTRQQVQDADDAATRRQIRATHDRIWADRSCCQLCGGTRPTRGFPDEMHEDPPRSATRGLPPCERFNVRVCGRLCKPCHTDVTEKRLRVVFHDPVRRFDGPVSGVEA